MRTRTLAGLALFLMIRLGSAALTFGGAEPSAAPQERGGLLERGEAALARGEVAQAAEVFERAATMMHAADAEMGLLRTYMQSGAYRRPLSLAAHVAGAHRDEPAGAVLYAWLLHAGGHGASAQRVLDEAEKRKPADPLLAEARAQLRSAAPVADGALLSAPWRVAPYDTAAPLPATARIAGSGLLLDRGRHAIIPLIEARALWLRDGLGRRSAAQVERRIESLGLMVLRLDDPIKDASTPPLASRDPFVGSPVFATDYSPTTGAAPAWPLLHVGFVGNVDGSRGRQKLRVVMPAGAQGGPVFNNGGLLVGIAVRGADGQDLLIPVSALKKEIGELLGAVADQSPAQRAPVDAIYEMAMPVTLQVIALP